VQADVATASLHSKDGARQYIDLASYLFGWALDEEGRRALYLDRSISVHHGQMTSAWIYKSTTSTNTFSKGVLMLQST